MEQAFRHLAMSGTPNGTDLEPTERWLAALEQVRSKVIAVANAL